MHLKFVRLPLCSCHVECQLLIIHIPAQLLHELSAMNELNFMFMIKFVLFAISMPGRIPGVSPSMSHFILRTNSLGIQCDSFFMDLKLGAPTCGMILALHSMIIPKLIHFTLGQYLHLYSLKLWRIILAYTFSMHVCAFLVSNLGVDAASWTVCMFNFSRWMLNRLLKLLLPVYNTQYIIVHIVYTYITYNIYSTCIHIYISLYVCLCVCAYICVLILDVIIMYSLCLKKKFIF